jgi:hypothetical protein
MGGTMMIESAREFGQQYAELIEAAEFMLRAYPCTFAVAPGCGEPDGCPACSLRAALRAEQQQRLPDPKPEPLF